MTPHWELGGVRVYAITDLVEYGVIDQIFPSATASAIDAQSDWLAPWALTPGEGMIMAYHAFLIETDNALTLVDTCVGNDKVRPVPEWDRRRGEFLDRFRETGFAPSDVSTLFCTHMHPDHVGWNTKLVGGRWVPTFARARHLFVEEEFEATRSRDSMSLYWEDSIQPIVDAALVDLVDAEYVAGRVALVPSPGHTEGHVCVAIHGDRADAMITGDLVHLPIQFAHLNWASRYDMDASRTERERRRFARRWSEGNTLILGNHFPSPIAGYVAAHGDAYRFELDEAAQ